MKLLLIRHAESQGNVEQVLQGQQEHPLSEHGHAQAKLLARYLAVEMWQPTHIYSSPLQRAFQTAEYCAELCPGDYSIELQPTLLEIHNGILQGLTWEEAQRQYPQLCEQLTRSKTWLPIPQSEYPDQVFSRAQAWMQWLLHHHENCDRLWVFSHGGFLQQLVSQILGSDRVWGITIPPTGLFEFDLDLEHWLTRSQDRYTGHLFRMLRFNQTPHLTKS